VSARLYPRQSLHLGLFISDNRCVYVMLRYAVARSYLRPTDPGLTPAGHGRARRTSSRLQTTYKRGPGPNLIISRTARTSREVLNRRLMLFINSPCDVRGCDDRAVVGVWQAAAEGPILRIYSETRAHAPQALIGRSFVAMSICVMNS